MTTMNQAEFARHIGKTRGYIAQLNSAGRLVMVGDKVNVEESIKRIDETRDPSKEGVAQRHEEERQAKLSGFEIPQTMPEAGLAMAAGEKAGNVYQQSRALKEKYNAMAAKRDYELSVGKLLVAEDVISVISGAAAVVRIRLESLPDILSPQFAAETDEQKIRSMFLDHIEHVLGEMSQQFKKLAKGEK